MKRSPYFLFLLLVLASVVLGACGGSPTDSSAQTGIEPLDVEPSHNMCVFMDTTSEFCVWGIQYPSNFKFDWEGDPKSITIGGQEVEKSKEIPGIYAGDVKVGKNICRNLGSWTGHPGDFDPKKVNVNVEQTWTYYGCPTPH